MNACELASAANEWNSTLHYYNWGENMGSPSYSFKSIAFAMSSLSEGGSSFHFSLSLFSFNRHFRIY